LAPFAGNDAAKKLSRGAFFASELCSPQRQEKVLSSKGKAERRKAHCPTNVRIADKSTQSAQLICSRGCALLSLRARLSALTLAALATGSTRWLSSRTGFPAGFG